MACIDIDFGEAISRAEQIAECAVKIQSEADSVIEGESVIASAWKGDSANVFLRKFDKHSNSLKKHSIELKENADKLKKSAERLRGVENWGISLFLN